MAGESPSRWPTPAPASPPSTCPTSSTASTAPTPPAPAVPAGSAWGWPSSRASSHSTAAPPPSPARRARGRASRSPSRAERPHLRLLSPSQNDKSVVDSLPRLGYLFLHYEIVI